MNIWIPQIPAVPLAVIQAPHLLKRLKKRDVLITIKTNSFVINSKSLSKWVLSALSLLRRSQKAMSFLKLTALTKLLFQRLRFSFNQSYNLNCQSQRRKRTVREKHHPLKLTGHLKKTKNCLDLCKFTEMPRGIDFASLWLIKQKLDALRDIWRLQGKQKREKKVLITRKPFQFLLLVTQAHNGHLKKMNFWNLKLLNSELKIGWLSLGF